MTYYLVRGNALVAEIDMSGTDILALPLLGSINTLSLINKQHIQALMTNLGLTMQATLDAMNIQDHRSITIKSIILGPDVSGITPWPVYKLITINDYALYEIDSVTADLLTIHATMWEMSPSHTLGLLAIVHEFGSTFYDSVVRTQTGMTIPQALQRRDNIANYLENLGHSNTTTLRAATTEHIQMQGIVEALGYTMQQLWSAMCDV